MPTSVYKVQPVDGATPPEMFSRWMKVVAVSLWPPVGPSVSILFIGVLMVAGAPPSSPTR